MNINKKKWKLEYLESLPQQDLISKKSTKNQHYIIY